MQPESVSATSKREDDSLIAVNEAQRRIYIAVA